jgi:hypothetical protein
MPFTLCACENSGTVVWVCKKFGIWEFHKELPSRSSFPFDRAILTTTLPEVVHAFLHHERSYTRYTHAQGVVLDINMRNFFSTLIAY